VSGTYALGRTDPRSTDAGFTKEEADRLAAEWGQVLGGSPFTVTDLLPELEQRFQPGTRVWLGQRVHWRRGQAGVVSAGEPESFALWQPEAGQVPWFIGQGGAHVFVTLDDGYASWWSAGWLETR
jgi:hypothetical protein